MFGAWGRSGCVYTTLIGGSAGYGEQSCVKLSIAPARERLADFTERHRGDVPLKEVDQLSRHRSLVEPLALVDGAVLAWSFPTEQLS